MFLRTHKKIYEFNFGLKGLIIMRENADLVMANDKRFILYCGLVSRQPAITFQEIDEIINECDLSQLDITPNILSLFAVYCSSKRFNKVYPGSIQLPVARAAASVKILLPLACSR